MDVEYNIYRNRVIVLIESLNKVSICVLRFVKIILDNVVVFNVLINEE